MDAKILHPPHSVGTANTGGIQYLHVSMYHVAYKHKKRVMRIKDLLVRV